METLITVMVTSNETVKPLLILNKNFCRRLTVIKSVRSVISEAGNAVCGVVYSSSAEIFRFNVSFYLHLISSRPASGSQL